MIHCCIDSAPVPEERQKRKGAARFTCSDECYAELRRSTKSSKRSYRFGPDDRALLLRLRRAKFTLSDFPAFAAWWREWQKRAKSEPDEQGKAADTARHDLNAGA